ncbi:MAG TPA: ATP-binding cassette domain-containing protein [Bacillota bacterium]|nr:ATP-binding cassette domain-containing protein [Bacillota bacterium]HOL09542.1 ATP-binding cassette domain-containing protein [Bacillota bacterium]HPO97487.1 ATP-binding cassette domain-containing protein [Bacillota bacterium]
MAEAVVETNFQIATGSTPQFEIGHTNTEVFPKLSVNELVITFENLATGELTAAVDKVSIDIEPGEFVSIVGLSGCGKTSFLNAIAGLIKPNSGSIRVNGQPVSGPGHDRAVVFQKASLLPWRSVLNNIIYGLELRGVRKNEARKLAEKYIEMVHLKGFEHYYPHQLSGGMQQRVNLARALVCEPEILLLDEPFAALDAITREEMQNELLSLWEQTRKTVLMVTHQIDEAVLLSDRIIIFSARPAKIVEEVRVNLPRPRTPHLKDDAEFDYLAKKIWGQIHTAAGKKVNVEYEI